MKPLPALAISLLLLFSGCSSPVSQEAAEATAKQFVQQHVQFFTQNDSAASNVSTYAFDAVSSYKEDGNYVVALHIISVANPDKDNSLVVKVGQNGKVLEFNGRPVPE
jgi:hypothetical protein